MKTILLSEKETVTLVRDIDNEQQSIRALSKLLESFVTEKIGVIGKPEIQMFSGIAGLLNNSANSLEAISLKVAERIDRAY